MGNIFEFFLCCVLFKMIGFLMMFEYDKLLYYIENMMLLLCNVMVFIVFKMIFVNFSKRVLILLCVKNYLENFICGNYVNVN